MFVRNLTGAVLGATIGAAVAAVSAALLFGFQIVLFDLHDLTDRAADIRRMMEFLPTATLAGALVGGIYGMVTRLPSRRARILTGVVVVAGCAVLTGILAVAQQGGPPMPVVLAIFTGGALVVAFAVLPKRRRWGK
jgi:peptidoglycan/LPS O-acetylase OafA/YrhL